MSKQLVATHERIDPKLVTAEDLVRAIKDGTVIYLAERLGFSQPLADIFVVWHSAAKHLAQNITLPEERQHDNVVVWRGEMPEPLPFDEVAS